MINGFPSKPFHSKKPNPDFNFHHRCEKLGITHLMFADDLLLFARADKISLQLMLKAFDLFSKASGLKANMDKSNIFFGGIFSDDKEQILASVNIPEGELPFRYLGFH